MTSQHPPELARADYLLTADELSQKYNPNGYGEHPRFMRHHWRAVVANKDTLRSYWQWVESELEQEHNDGD